jgi:stage III sporulation protein AD
MSLFSICCFAVASVILVILVKQLKNEIAMPISVFVTVSLSIVCVSLIEPISDYINEISDSADYGPYVKVMMKSFGIALVSSGSADICRDCGENAVAAKVELVGKCAIMLTSLPLIRSLLTLAEDIMYA